MFSDSEKKGWIIIAADLVIVLLVYFLYTQIRTLENSVQRRNDGINYTLSVKPVSEDSIPVTFSLKSRRRTPYTVQMPDGVTLLLYDAKNNVHWRGQLKISRSVAIGAGERRGWQRTIPTSDRLNQPFYVGFYIDDERQGKVKVPE